MQDLSNEMEDLFRKAVEYYPLKPCDSQWENLSNRIKSKKRRFLFAPLAIVRRNSRTHIFFRIHDPDPYCNYFFGSSHQKNGNKQRCESRRTLKYIKFNST